MHGQQNIKICKVHGFFVILRECETGCVALVGKLGLTAEVQCLFSSHQR